MSALRPTGRFLPFTNNVQRTQKPLVPGGFPQSLSGSESETDVSTSNENLSNEERYVIRHTARVEPQGQENLQENANRNSLKEAVAGGSNRSSLKDSIGGPNSNRSSLDVSSSSYNTLIIHNASQEDNWTGRLSGIRDRANEIQNHTANSASYHPLIAHQEMLKKTANKAVGGPVKEHPTLPRPSGNYIDIGGHRIYTGPPEHGVQEITEIPDDYLNQSSVLKHLAKEVAQSPTNRSHRGTTGSTPPASPASSAGRSHSRTPTHNDADAAYDVKVNSPRAKLFQGNSRIKGKVSKEKLNLSRSQPDLSSVGVRPLPGGAEGTSWSSEAGTDIDDDGTCFSEMLDGLAQENAQLKAQLDEAWQKIAKTQKLEDEVSAVHRAHEELVNSCERRERLERAARARLQSDCRRLHHINTALREQVELLSGQMMRPLDSISPNADNLRKELQNREMLITQLITHNKELACAKERQEIEIAAQRATLQEQRTHIDILDTALTNAQTNVVRLEEECRHAQSYIERVAQLQRALGSLQQASDRREQTERKLRFQLERELQNLRSREGSAGGVSGASGNNVSSDMRRLLREKDERILALEGEAGKWEQRYLEEAALRQAAIDAASIPKDAKIAALEKTSQESERLMAEARCEKIRHMDELHDAQKKWADMEGRVKELESKVAERDAMIKVLQKHTQSQAYAAANEAPGSMRNNASREELVGFSGGTSSNASFSSGECQLYGHSHLRHHSHHSHVLHLPPAPSPSPLSLHKYGSTTNGNSMMKSNINTAASNFDTTKRTLDCQLAQLDSRIAGASGANATPVSLGDANNSDHLRDRFASVTLASVEANTFY